MKTLTMIFLCAVFLPAGAQQTSGLRSILLEQLHTTHDVEDWFVPINVALDGLTIAQAQWTDGKGNHSVGQLAYHLLFWDSQQLAKLTGTPPEKLPATNDETFTEFDASQWQATVTKLDSVMQAIEQVVENASEERLLEIASSIEHISAHNAYHVGQIVYIRKLQGAWDPKNGVK